MMSYEYESVPTHSGDVGEDPGIRPTGSIAAELDEAVPGTVFVSMYEDDTVGEHAYIRTVDARGWALHVLELCAKEDGKSALASLQADALRSAARAFATGDWNDAFLAGNVEDDLSAVRATEFWLLDCADRLETGSSYE